jgi:hypothetical protein
MSNSTLTTPADALRMAYAAYCDGMDDGWHGPFARHHGPDAPAIYAALKAGRAQARADDAAYLASPAGQPHP